MQDSDDDESTNGEMQFECDLSEIEFSDDTMASTPTGLYSESTSDDNTMDSGPPPLGLRDLDNYRSSVGLDNVPPTA